MSDSGRYSAGKVKRVLWDISGAFGDIGVFFPISIALIVKNGFNPTALFLTAGLFYVFSAYYFRITMPVQPLKAMSAIAIATGLSYEVINAAGVIMGAILILLSVTGLSVTLGRIFTVAVVRGIQLGLGLILIKTSFQLITVEPVIAVTAFAVLLLSLFIIKKIPPLVPIMVLGVIIVVEKIGAMHIGPMPLAPALPDGANAWLGLNMLVLPQLALTFGNAIVATEATGKILYGKRAERLTYRSIPMSMGIANIMSGFAGGVPMCHGSGGLTAHKTFGATRERSGYIIGFTFIALALLLGNSALSVVSAFPSGILGVLLCYVGIQHSLFMKDIMADKRAVFIATTVAVTGFITNNLTVGFLLGLGIHYSRVGIVRVIRHIG